MKLKDFWTFKVEAAEPAPSSEEEDELVDQQEQLRNSCAEKYKISKLYDILGQCNQRVNSREKTQETCEQELFDYVAALDNCVAQTLFSKLV